MGYISEFDIKDIESILMDLPRPVVKSVFVIGTSLTIGFIYWMSQI